MVVEKSFKKSKGGWRCGDSFISKKAKCYTDPVTKQKTKQPITYNAYRKKRADAIAAANRGKQLSPQEKVLVDRVESDRERLVKKKEKRFIEAAARRVGSSKVLSGGIAEVDPSKIQVDAHRFQYKIAGANTQSGSVGSLSGVKKWDPNLAGVIQVWADPKDKQVYVVNGHNRLALEQKLGVPKRPAIFLKAKSAPEARAIGALTNIAEGRGNAKDAAKFFRDSGIEVKDLERKGIPLKEKIATDGLALSNLSDGLFNSVIQGDLAEARGVVIGEKIKNPVQQEALVKLIGREEKRGKRITNDVISELADMTKTAPIKQEDNSGSLSALLGFAPEEKSLAIEKAQVTASIKRQLTKEEKFFGTVGKTKAASELTKAGNKINIDESAEISKNAATTSTLFEKKKFDAGKIDNILNQSAKRLADGEKIDKITKEARQEIEDYLQQTFKYGKGKRAGASNSNFRRARVICNFSKSDNHYYQTRNGKKVKVRKKKRGNARVSRAYSTRKKNKINPVVREDLVTAARYAGTSIGFLGGAAAGAYLVAKTGRNGMLRNSAIAAGAVTGSAVSAILANHLLHKYENGS